MKALLLAIVLAFTLVACSNPADSPECRKWQAEMLSRYHLAAVVEAPEMTFVDADLISKRPEGCPIP